MYHDPQHWSVAKCDDTWTRKLLLSSVPLRQFRTPIQKQLPERPDNTATGCVVDYGGKRLLLTVEHGAARGSGWAIELGHREGQLFFYPLEDLRVFGKLSFNTLHMSLVDFAIASLPSRFESHSQDFDEDGNVIHEEPRLVLTPAFGERPKTSVVYGFSGYRLYELFPDHCAPRRQILQFEQRVFDHLEFVDEEEEYSIFKFPNRHPGDDEIRGCSGAPVLGQDGSFVGLVCGGNERKGTVHALSLWRFKSMLDLETGVAPSLAEPLSSKP